MNILMAILKWIVEIPEKIMRFWFPYLFYFDPENPEPRERETWFERRQRIRREKKREKANQTPSKGSKSKSKVAEKAPQTPNTSKPSDVLEFREDELGVKIIDASEPFDDDDAFDTMLKSASNVAYFYHDENYHQIAVKFQPGSRKVHYQKRDDIARKQLKPLLFPNANQPFDRTHVIPIAYHGSENDNRLLVGFNSKLNREDLRDFESKVGQFNDKQTILWFVSIDKQDDGSAIWYANVWDERGDVLISDSFHDKDKFVWK